jgi:AcrR family transcriptional regulator
VPKVASLKQLLEEKEFDKLTVQEITEAATLNRATFYAHYPDKFAILEELIRVTFLELLAQRHVQYVGTCSSAFQAIILAVCDYLAGVQKSLSSKQHQFEPFVEAAPGGASHPRRDNRRYCQLGNLRSHETVGQYRGTRFR